MQNAFFLRNDKEIDKRRILRGSKSKVLFSVIGSNKKICTRRTIINIYVISICPKFVFVFFANKN